jgi:hypothetical protein
LLVPRPFDKLVEPVTAPDIPMGKRVKFYREGRGLSHAD